MSVSLAMSVKQHMQIFFVCSLSLSLKNKRDAPLAPVMTSQKRLMFVYFRNVIHSVPAYLTVCSTWLCISLNSLQSFSDRACWSLNHCSIQDVWTFCPSNAKHLTQWHHIMALSNRVQNMNDNKVRKLDKTKRRICDV